MVISSQLFYSRLDCRACPISTSRTTHNIQTVMELFPCPCQHGWGRSHSFHTSDCTSTDIAKIMNFILNKRGSSHFTEWKSILESNLGGFWSQETGPVLSIHLWLNQVLAEHLTPKLKESDSLRQFFFWGSAMNLLSVKEIQDINHLRQIKIYFLAFKTCEVIEHWIHRLDVCQVSQSTHAFEMY